VGKIHENKHPQLTGTIVLQPGHGGGQGTADEAPPIQMHWKVPQSSVSGLAISSLQLTNEKYKPYKGVRTVAKAGKFQVRTV
jgi:AP-3 complex subunit mu